MKRDATTRVTRWMIIGGGVLLTMVASAAGAQTTGQTAGTSEQGANKASGKALGKAPVIARPLDGLVGQHILVLPAQYLTFSDTMGWSMQAPPTRTYLQTIDDELSFALEERGLRANWIFSDAITRSAERNVGFSADPHALQATSLRIGVKNKEFQLAEPLASQLRSLIALNDARYVLFPVEVRFTNAPGGVGVGRVCAMVRVVVVDARRSQIQWSGDVLGAPMATFSPAVAADLASRIADLIAPSN